MPTIPNPKKLAVALAAAGCTCGCDTMAVDPAPQPMVCASAGQRVLDGVSAWMQTGTDQLHFTAQTIYSNSHWVSAEVVDVVGATLGQVTTPTNQTVDIMFTLAATPPTTVSFTVRATVASDSYSNGTCPVDQRFTLTVTDARSVQIAKNDRGALPLGARDRAAIAIVDRADGELILQASTTFPGRHSFAWTATGGEITALDASRARWRLPPGSGFHQAHLVTDLDEAGVAFDTLEIEVT